MSSGTVRYRFYSRWGLGSIAIAKLIIFSGITVGMGLITLGGIALLCVPEVLGRMTGTSAAITPMLGGACLAVPIAYLVAAAAGAKPLRFKGWKLELPSLPLALGQVLIGTLNFALVAACLHQALNAVSEASYPAVVSVYVLANATAIASHVPGGKGRSGGACENGGAPTGAGGTIVHFTSQDCAVEAGRAESCGGQLMKKKTSIGDYGFIALVSDTEGNIIGIHSLK